MTYKEFKAKYQHIKPCMKPNKLDFPLNVIATTEDGMNEFNDILDFIHSLRDCGELDGRVMPLTKSGGIKKTPYADHHQTYAIIASKSMIEILLCYKDYYRFQFRREFRKDMGEMSGFRSFYLFKKKLKEFGVDLESDSELKVSKEKGQQFKSLIPSPIIKYDETIKDQTLTNVHHLDIHSAHMAGMCEVFPRLKPTIEYFYNKRKENKRYKAVLTHIWGFCQSKYVQYQYAHLSWAGLRRTNDKIEWLTNLLIQSGRKPVLWNTDGIWYQGEVFHGFDEGKNLGQWSNDHINCTFRAKSKGTYEFIEDGQYNVVARGPRELDKIKPRDEWSWGDIYHTGKIIGFSWDDTQEYLFREDTVDE